MRTTIRVVVVLAALSLPVSAWAEDVTAQWAKARCAQNVCPVGTHIACQFQASTGPKCEGAVLPIMTKQWIAAWLDAHNAVRASVKNATPPLPKIEWSDDLAKQARLVASTCKFGHSECRNTPEFEYAGELLHLNSTIESSFQLTLEHASKVVTVWADERKQAECAPSKINPYRKDERATCGHYTQLVKRKSMAVGCAVAVFNRNGSKNVLTVCHYARTNVLGENTY